MNIKYFVEAKATASLEEEIKKELEQEDPAEAKAVLDESIGNTDDTKSS